MKQFAQLILIAAFSILVACNSSVSSVDTKNSDVGFHNRVDSFLTAYNTRYQELMIPSSEAQWKLNTHIVKGDTVTKQVAQEAA